MPGNDTPTVNLYITLVGALVLTAWALLIGVRKLRKTGLTENVLIAIRLTGLFFAGAPLIALACALLLQWTGSETLQFVWQREWLVAGLVVMLIGFGLNRWAENRLGLNDEPSRHH